MKIITLSFQRKAAAFLLGALLFCVAVPAFAAEVVVRLEPGRELGSGARLGVNVGHRTGWGAEQLMASILRNPGLESGVDAALVVVAEATPSVVVDTLPWATRPAGFWSGARFTVLSGSAQGRSGRIADHVNVVRNGRTLNRLDLAASVHGLKAGDVLSVRGQVDNQLPSPWVKAGLVVTRSAQARPGSPGHASVRLTATPGHRAALVQHLDGITARAGKLLEVNGRWNLSLWAKTESEGATLRVQWGRVGQPSWIDKEVRLTSNWQAHQWSLQASDSGPPAPMQFSLSIERGVVDVDDIELVESTRHSSGFRNNVVDALLALKPGYLRDWQGQLADDTVNRSASSLARRPTRYRTGPHDWIHSYSTEEFADLSAAVGASPWFVLPSTSTPEEAFQFGLLLQAIWRKHRFTEIVVEHGNEHWNPLFGHAGVGDEHTLARILESVFRELKRGAGADVPLIRTVGAQFVNPGRSVALQSLLTQGVLESIAVAPYAASRMDSSDSFEALARRAAIEGSSTFLKWQSAIQRSGNGLDVYEVNLHTTIGDAGPRSRIEWLNSPHAQAALAARLLTAWVHGVRRQCAYVLSGFDTLLDGPAGGFVPLFGLVRDFNGAPSLRPSGLLIAQINHLAGGTRQLAACRSGDCAGVIALFDGDPMGLLAVSNRPDSVRLQLPCAAEGRRWTRWSSLEGDRTPLPGPRCDKGRVETTLRAFEFIVFQPEGDTN